jgi:predicted metal-binding protein
MQTEDMCPATTDFKVIKEKKCAFEGIAIAFASCITRGNPIGFACPHAEKMIEATKKKLSYNIKIIEYTH